MARRKSKSDIAITESEQIDLFLARGQELWNTRARRSGFNLSFSMKGDLDTKEVTTRIDEPDLEDVRSFLTIFRKFISPDSPIFLMKIYNICHQHITDATCREYLAEARDIWRQLHKESDTGITVTVNSNDLSPADIVDIWINGHYFHDDIEKKRMLDSMEPYQLNASRTVFLDFVIETTKIIVNLAQNIRASREKGFLKL